MSIRFGEGTLIYPVLGAVAITDTTTVTEFVDLDLANWVSFLVSFGVVTSGGGASCNTVLITAVGSSIASTAGGDLIGFDYRLSEQIGTHGWGAITDGTTAGTAFTAGAAELSSRSVLIDIDPAELAAMGETHRWVGLKLECITSLAVTASVTAFIEPRYPGNDIPSST